ncbi:hypothetical protein AVEN_106380-1 [Araneus ventricosus]|uniref:Uncharacterized protein n=1 Tax=Araneus ventricosus TaxID=182803 RepID=A0A4Y2ASA3_ARAVE|nr:hypothetical protein AVEN_106380-1 [Araneus ventricosus]
MIIFSVRWFGKWCFGEIKPKFMYSCNMSIHLVLGRGLQDLVFGIGGSRVRNPIPTVILRKCRLGAPVNCCGGLGTEICVVLVNFPRFRNMRNIPNSHCVVAKLNDYIIK